MNTKEKGTNKKVPKNEFLFLEVVIKFSNPIFKFKFNFQKLFWLKCFPFSFEFCVEDLNSI